MTTQEQRSVPTAAVILSLTDLRYVAASSPGEPAAPATSPLAIRSEVVLLLPWSLLPTIAALEAHARATPYEHDPQFAPEDWLPTWHHFVDADEQLTSRVVEAMSQKARVLELAPSATRRHHVFGTVRQTREMLPLTVSTAPEGSTDEADRHGQDTRAAESIGSLNVLVTPGTSVDTDA
ncbi:MAG TPA: hypothetical protein VGZ03_01400 [Acidimicrobiales bacterium]|jgi:hypothetical protein|nr:hypothetical protein [Acidimicrobiales bacterium]